MWLRALDGKRRIGGGKGNTRGTPQGGVASPLLANIYMNRFLKYWRRGDRGEDFGTHSQPLSTATHPALHNPITLCRPSQAQKSRQLDRSVPVKHHRLDPRRRTLGGPASAVCAVRLSLSRAY
jgi:hypothetical protein